MANLLGQNLSNVAQQSIMALAIKFSLVGSMTFKVGTAFSTYRCVMFKTLD